MAEKPSSIDRVKAAAETAGLPIEIRQMPQSTRTAAEAAAACGCSVAQIVKSLIFRKATSGAPILILVSGKNRVDETAIKVAIGDTLRRVDADQVRVLTGFSIGGVAPLGSLSPLATFMDADLMGFDVVWAAAGAPTAVFSVQPAALAAATRAEIVRVA